MAGQSESFDYYLRLVVQAQGANASLRSISSLLRGIGLLGDKTNASLGKTALRLGAVAAAAGITLKLLLQMYKGAKDFNSVMARTQAMGLDTKTSNNMIQMAKSLSVSSDSIVTSAEALNDINDMIQNMGLSPKSVMSIAPQTLMMQKALIGLSGGDTEAGRQQAESIAQLSVQLNRLRGARTMDEFNDHIKDTNELLFKMREALGDSAFAKFADSLQNLRSPVLASLSPQGLAKLAAFSTAAGPKGEEVISTVEELRKFATSPRKSSIANFLPQLGMFGFTNLLATAGGVPFAFKGKLQKQFQADPLGFIQSEIFPRVQGFLQAHQKTPVTSQEMINAMQQIFKGSPDLADTATMMLQGETSGAAGNIMARMNESRTIENEALKVSEDNLAASTASLSKAFDNLFQQFEPLVKMLVPVINAIASYVKVVTGFIQTITDITKKVLDFVFTVAGKVIHIPGAIFDGIHFGTPPTATPAAPSGKGPTISNRQFLSMIGAPDLGGKPSAMPFNFDMPSVPKAAPASVTGSMPIKVEINVNATDPAAGNKIAHDTARHLVRILNNGALNAVTPDGIHMSPAFTGKQ